VPENSSLRLLLGLGVALLLRDGSIAAAVGQRLPFAFGWRSGSSVLFASLATFRTRRSNELWQMDFKSPKGCQQPVGPLSVIDDHSRYVVRWKKLEARGPKPCRNGWKRLSRLCSRVMSNCPMISSMEAPA